jgi:Family of unknown function (DUF6445)
MYHTSLIIQENFYSNPLEVRQYALSQEFSVRGNYPGLRTKPCIAAGVKESIEDIVKAHAGKITWFGTGDGKEGDYTGSFQLTYAKDRTWIHNDGNCSWAGVLYLTPDAPVSGGTGLFKHKRTGWMQVPRKSDGTQDIDLLNNTIEGWEYQDYTKWDLHDKIGNKFNRLVMYRGDYFHASLDYFGDNPQNGRLFQVFFFNTEY